MEQFRQIGEALGSLKALMVFRDNIQINRRQCDLLLDMFDSAYKSISEEMRENLKFEERNLKWKVLEMSLKQLHWIFKEGEAYIKESLETKDWWVKAITLYQNSDCVELHINNLLSCIPVVIEAIESAAELSGWEHDEMQKRKRVYSNMYHKEWIDPQLFHWKLAKQYLVTPDFCNRIDSVWKEDRWVLQNKIREKENSGLRKQERQLADLLLRNLDSSESLNDKLLPSSVLLGSKDYSVRRRLGNCSQYKEVYWLGESFVMRHVFGDVEAVASDISSLLSLSHPNILHFLCGFTDDEKKECLLVMELTNKSLCDFIKETCGARKRIPFHTPVAVDLMLQMARGMEYLHSNKIYHGDLNPSSIHVKLRGTSPEGYMHAKVSGFGLCGLSSIPQKSAEKNLNETQQFIWLSPEVLEEQEQPGRKGNLKFTEKADVYSYGMICFQLLTGKVPFEDSHLQGDKMSRNIRAGERPLFPCKPPKCITNMIKRCWHANPSLRPGFPSICRILRYVKRSLLMNPDYNNQSELPPMPLVDYYDIDSRLQRIFPAWETSNMLSTSQIPFQMFVYRVLEKDRTVATPKDTSESGSDRNSISADENVTTDDPYSSATERSLPSPEPLPRIRSILKKSPDIKAKHPMTPKGRSLRPSLIPPMTSRSRSLRETSESRLLLTTPRLRRTSSGHVSDSEVS